ncbi:cold-shock protein [Streptomyces graminofaciens]
MTAAVRSSFHHSAIGTGGFRSLEEKQRVEFSVGQGPKVMQADQVRAR